MKYHLRPLAAMAKSGKSARKAPAKSAPPVSLALAADPHSIWSRDEWPFIREIRAIPFDDDPRLVFADWLEERGDTRAEFIRLQCQLANLRARDPQYPGMTQRVDAILEKQRTKWLSPYAEIPGTHWGIDGVFWNFAGKGSRHHFSRGFAEAVQPKSVSAFVKRAKLLIDELGFHEVFLSIESKREGQALAKLPQLARIGTLILPASEHVEPILVSPKLGPLWRLDVSDPRGIGSGLRTFLEGPSSHRLRWLKVRGVVRPKDMQAILEWEGIEQLDTFGFVSDAWGEALEQIASSRLRPSRLQLSTPNFTADEFVAKCNRLFAAPVLAEATTLRIDLLPENMGRVFGKLVLPPKLTRLLISGAIRDADIAGLARTDAFRQLTHLALSGDYSTSLRDPAALSLARASGLDRLQSLDLSDSSFTDKGAEALVQSEALASLMHLNLERSKVGNEFKPGLRKAFRGKLEI